MKTTIQVEKISKEFKSLEIKNLNFKLNKLTVLDNINLEINPGEIFGLIGPNGSGKTTFLKLISGLLLPDFGEIKFKDNNFNSAVPKIGYVNSNFRSFYWRLTGRQNLKFFCSLLNINNSETNKIIDNFSNFFNIDDKMDRKFMFYSSGEMQYFSIIRALLDNPDILLLDEPCSNIDPISAQRVMDFFFKYLNSRDVTTVWCSHDLQEIKNISSKYGILDKGKLSSVKKIENINTRLLKNYFIKISYDDYSKLFDTGLEFQSTEDKENLLKVRFSSESINLNDGLQRIISSEIVIYSIFCIDETIEIENNLKKLIS